MGLKVLHLIDSGGLYGAEKVLLTLVKEQLKQGLEPMILSAGEPQLGDKAIAVEANRLGLPVTSWFMKPGLNLSEAKKIISWAQEGDYSVLHSHGYKFNILMGVIPKKVRRLPLVTTLHGYVNAPRLSKMWLYECLDKWLLSFFDGVVIVGEAMERQIPARLRKSGRLSVIRNGLDLDAANEASRKPLNEELAAFSEKHDPLILGVGRLSVEKGFDRLVEAFPLIKSTFPNAGLLIIGEGHQRAGIEEIIHREKIENVWLPGYCSDILAIMSKSTMLVMPSTTEGLPVTLLEAMAVGCPVAVTDVGEMSQVLGCGQGGMILQNKSSSSLGAELIEHLNNSELIEKKKAWCQKSVREHFSARAMAEQYHLVYEKPLAEDVS